MSFNVSFYAFSKDTNSTKQPPAETATTFTCVLKSPCSVVNPTLRLQWNDNPSVFNYAYIPEFNRYYFIDDWTFSTGMWEASLSVDALASWKSYIGDSVEYVIRSSAEYDGSIIDTLYPTKTDVQLKVSVSAAGESQNPFVSNFNEGRYVVGIVNSDTNAIGTVSYYSFTNAQFRNFCSALMSNATWFTDGITEIGDELAKCLFNPFQYIASCMWFPCRFAGTAVTEIQYGWWLMPTSASRLTSTLSAPGAVFNLPNHPQISRGDYLNKSVFSRYTLSWPVFGSFPLPPEIVGGGTVSCQCYVDAISGSGTLVCLCRGATVFTTQVSVGVPIQISQMSQDVAGFGSAVASGAASLLSLDIGGLFNSIGDAVSSALPQLSTTGKNGSGSAYMFNPSVECEFFQVVEEDREHRGRPLMKRRKISDLGGYIVCSDTEVDIPCTSREIDSVKSKMDAGFYYE